MKSENYYEVDGVYKKRIIDIDVPEVLSVEIDSSTKIRILKSELAKYKEDVEQVELFGMERYDYEEKKKRCADIILELRILEKEVKDV